MNPLNTEKKFDELVESLINDCEDEIRDYFVEGFIKKLSERFLIHEASTAIDDIIRLSRKVKK